MLSEDKCCNLYILSPQCKLSHCPTFTSSFCSFFWWSPVSRRSCTIFVVDKTFVFRKPRLVSCKWYQANFKCFRFLRIINWNCCQEEMKAIEINKWMNKRSVLGEWRLHCLWLWAGGMCEQPPSVQLKLFLPRWQNIPDACGCVCGWSKVKQERLIFKKKNTARSST